MSKKQKCPALTFVSAGHFEKLCAYSEGRKGWKLSQYYFPTMSNTYINT